MKIPTELFCCTLVGSFITRQPCPAPFSFLVGWEADKAAFQPLCGLASQSPAYMQKRCCRAPQGSAVSLLLFSIYMKLLEIICHDGGRYHRADDTQLYISTHGEFRDVATTLCWFPEAAEVWMGSDRLKLTLARWSSSRSFWLLGELSSLIMDGVALPNPT